MKGQVGMLRAVGRFVTSTLIVTLLAGTAWTGRASVARVDVDPALHSGDVALIQVAAGTAWTVAPDPTTAGATEVTVFDGIDMVSARVGDAPLTAIGTERSGLRAPTDATVVAAAGCRAPGPLSFRWGRRVLRRSTRTCSRAPQRRHGSPGSRWSRPPAMMAPSVAGSRRRVRIRS